MAENGQPVRLPPERTADTAAGRPLRADAARNREKVLRAAREAFAEWGYGVPLDEIAARAGVRSGIRTSVLIVLLKGMFASLAGSTDPSLHERVFTVVADGLRPRG